MNKIGLWICIAVAIAAVMYVAVFRNDDAQQPVIEDSQPSVVGEAQPPIVDPICEPGYELVGEGCIPASEACELGGDDYYYDEETQECLRR